MSLREKLERESVSWRPDLEDSDHPQVIEGEIFEIDTGISDYGEYHILSIEDEVAGVLWRWNAFGSVAEKAIAQKRPQVGDRIAIAYQGEKPSRNFPGKNYADWRVLLERAPANVAAVAPQQARPGGAALGEYLDKTNDVQAATNAAAKAELDEEPF